MTAAAQAELAPRLDRGAALPLYAQLRDALLAEVRDGGLEPGDRFPTEAAIQERFRVSRATVRQALADLEAFAGARAETLSGGMKQKLALCGALLTRPPLLVLDEPTTGIDVLARAALWTTIRDEARHALVIVSTNYLDEAERCDRILYMAGGRAVATGTPHALRRAAPIRVFHVTLAEPHAMLARDLRRAGLERVEPTPRGLRLETRRRRVEVEATFAALGLADDAFDLDALDADLETALLALMHDAQTCPEGLS
jgi:ABC-type multidrug transport system ATPase subunit